MGDLSRTKVSDYDVKWGSYSLGFVDKVSPDLKLVTKVIKVGTLGDIMIGERIIGLQGGVKVEVRELDAGTLNALMPWSATAGSATPGTSSTSIALVPAAFHTDLYDYAKQLTLHPTHLPASDVSQDMVLLKAVGHMSYLGERDGVKDNAMLIEFSFFPTGPR